MTKKSRLENMSGKDAMCSRGASPGKPLEQGTNHQAAVMPSAKGLRQSKPKSYTDRQTHSI